MHSEQEALDVSVESLVEVLFGDRPERGKFSDAALVEQRLQHENVALREEIDKASMFEEIVGTSPALQSLLSRVSKVAPTDSTVLIAGETGTGKELVARAIHKRSHRSSRTSTKAEKPPTPTALGRLAACSNISHRSNRRGVW